MGISRLNIGIANHKIFSFSMELERDPNYLISDQLKNGMAAWRVSITAEAATGKIRVQGSPVTGSPEHALKAVIAEASAAIRQATEKVLTELGGL